MQKQGIDVPVTPLLEAEERRRVLSTSRLQVILTSFVVVLLAGLSILMFVLVTRIFGSLTPSIEADLGWKARRGGPRSTPRPSAAS